MKKSLLVAALAANLLLSGCWDRREVNDLALVVAAGLDWNENNQLELSLQFVIPEATGGGQQEMGGGGGSSGKPPTFVVSAEGTTIFDAMSKLQEKLPRQIFWGHMRAVVIGESLAKEGIKQQLDFFIRHHGPRLRPNVFVCKGRAVKIMEVIPTVERSSAEALRELSKQQIGLNITIKELSQMLSGDSRSAVLPWVEIPKEGKKSGEIRLNGAVIFKEGKMVGYVDDKLTRGLLWLRNEVRSASITIAPERGHGLISFYMIRSQTRLIPHIQDGKWTITAKIVTEGDVSHNASNLNVGNPEIVKRLEKQLEQELNQRIRLALNRVQKEIGADVLGFAEAFHRKYPKEWAQAKHRWDEIFPEVDVKLDTRVYVRRPGGSSSPPDLPKEGVIGN